MTQQVLMPNQIVNLITDDTSFWPSQIFATVEVRTHEEVKRTMDVPGGVVLRSALWSKEGFVVKIATYYVEYLPVD